jgi:hypothetical protein
MQRPGPDRSKPVLRCQQLEIGLTNAKDQLLLFGCKLHIGASRLFAQLNRLSLFRGIIEGWTACTAMLARPPTGCR